MNGYEDGALIKHVKTKGGFTCSAKLFEGVVYFIAYSKGKHEWEERAYDPNTWDQHFIDFCDRMDSLNDTIFFS